jgi:hypothetical protein
LTLTAGIGEKLLASRGDYVEIHSVGTTAGDSTLNFTAKSKGKWGEDLSVRVRPMVGGTFRIVRNPDLADTTVRTTVATKADAGAASVAVDSATGLSNGDVVLVKGYEYKLSNVPTGTQIAGTAPLPSTATITVASVAGLADGDFVEIKGAKYKISNRNSGANTFDISPVVPATANWSVGTVVLKVPSTISITPPVHGESWDVGTAVQKLRRANDLTTPANTINVSGAASLYEGAIVELDNGKEKETGTVVSKDGERATLSTTLNKQYYEGHTLRVVEAEVAVRYAPSGAGPTETFSNLRLVEDGSLSNLVVQINARSNLVQVAKDATAYSQSDPAAFPCGPRGGWLNLANGDDGLDTLSSDDFVGVDRGSGNRTGIQAFEDIDEISICLAPGIWATVVHGALIDQCEILKDRFAILDPQDDLSLEDIQKAREPLDTNYAALYYPWIEVRDPSSGKNVDVAPSGHMAGIYARVDVERGVHKAPANEVIRGITKIAQDVTRREQDILNPKNINVLRFFPGRGNRVWGARVVTSDSSFKYINVRRLFIFVEESIDEGTQFVVFEPNDEPLWARVRQTITNFLTTVWHSGALQGSKPEDAFFVKCDRTTMTQDDIDNGRLICVIGIAPVKPAEFVIFRIQQKTQESQAN